MMKKVALIEQPFGLLRPSYKNRYILNSVTVRSPSSFCSRMMSFEADLEQTVVEIDVVVVDRIIKGNGDHLRHSVWFELAGNLSSVAGAEAIGEDTNSWVTGGCAVRVFVGGADVLIGAIAAVGRSVTEFLLLDTIAVATGQLASLTDRLVCGQQRQNEARLLELFAVLYVRLPVAGLLLDIERQSGRTTESEQTLRKR